MTSRYLLCRDMPCHEVNFSCMYKGSAPRAVDAARYARARNNTKKGEEAERKGP